MRTLKTPEEIMGNIELTHHEETLSYSFEEVELFIISAQHDALECVKENVRIVYRKEFYSGKLIPFIDESSIEILMPKE